MLKRTSPLLLLLAITGSSIVVRTKNVVVAFSVPGTAPVRTAVARSETPSRSEFLHTVRSELALVAGLAGGATIAPFPSYARGRATLIDFYDRYTPRIIAGGKFYKNDLKKLIAKNDWNSIKLATDEPPKKSKADRSKIDGGTAERAALAGQFSDARVLVACDLYASAFSDNSITPKTRAMKQEVEKMREVVRQLNATARAALAGSSSSSNSKKPSPIDLAKTETARQLYVDGGNAYNAYIFAANEELYIKLQKLPYL